MSKRRFEGPNFVRVGHHVTVGNRRPLADDFVPSHRSRLSRTGSGRGGGEGRDVRDTRKTGMENSMGNKDAKLARAIEATRLGPGVCAQDIDDLCHGADQAGAVGVCVPGVHLARAENALGGLPIVLVSVAGFPFGDGAPEALADEIRQLARLGAGEVDVVAPLGLALEGEWDRYGRMLEGAGHAARRAGVRWKAILECAALDENETQRAAAAAIRAGCDWLKTSTGFHPAGGARPSDVAFLRELAPADVGVKASGGIRTRSDALAMLDAGADRIGTSAPLRVLGRPTHAV